MKELTTTEAAERLGVAQVTVRLWCKQGRFPNARLVEHPRGDYWLIPPADLRGVEPRKPGPVPKPKPEKPARRSRKKQGAKTAP